MSPFRNRLLAVLGALLLALGLAACGSSTDARDELGGSGGGDHPEWKGITFVVGEQSDGIKSLAAASGVFENTSYKVKFAKFEFGPPLVAAAGSGDIDLGMVGAVPPIAGAAKSDGFKVVATLKPYSSEDPIENIIVPKGSRAKSLKDLRGKKIAVPQGSSAHGLLLKALKAEGLGPKDVKITYLDPKSGASAFDSGKVDAWAIWDPQGAFAIQKGARVLVKGVPPVDDTNLYYVASTRSLDDPERRAALADLQQKIAQAYAWGNARPEEHAKAISKDSGVPVEQVEKTVNAWRYRIQAVSPQQIKSGQELADLFLAAGEIDKPVHFADIVDTDLLPAGYNVG